MSDRPDPRQRRLRHEPLEDRRMLAGVTVSNGNDVVNGTVTSISALVADSGGDGISLREAILAANADAAADVIDFAPSVVGTIQLTNVGHVGELAIQHDLTTNGPGAAVLTIRAFGGAAAAGDGARIFRIDDGNIATFKSVALSGLMLAGGDVNGDGGAISNFENLSIADATISGNTAAGGANRGGGVLHFFGTLAIARTTINGNTAAHGGGVYASSVSNIADSLIHSNTSTLSSGGGGGIVAASFASTKMTITGSTISSNHARNNGGGIVNASPNSDGLVVRHSTITGNRADSDSVAGGAGGGLYTDSGATTSLDHVIIAGNLRQATIRSDQSGGVTELRFSLIGERGTGTFVDFGGNQIGPPGSPIDPLLAPLADNGGPTWTHAFLAGSRAIDAGDPAAVAGVGTVPLSDQRGAGFGRTANGDIFVGSKIDIGAFEQQSASLVNLFVNSLVDDNDGNFAPGDFSLREAIEIASEQTTSYTIAFASSLTSAGPAAIVLTMGELAPFGSLSIVGPGADLLTIDASGNDPTPTQDNRDGSRVFNLAFANEGIALNGLRLIGADSKSQGGAIFNQGQLTVTECTIADSSAGFGGGGIFNVGTLTVVGSTFSGNRGNSFGGGGVRNQGEMSLSDSTFQGNTAANGGGVLNLQGGQATLLRTTLSGNTANSGGGLYGGDLNAPSADGTINLIQSTVSGNRGSFGAGIFNAMSTVIISHSTITNHMDLAGDPGIAITSTNQIATVTRLQSTVVSGNSSDLSLQIVSPNPTPTQPYQSAGFNLIGAGPTAVFSELGDQNGVTDAMLGPLADNGGPTLTHALLPGSPAIDAGDPAAVAGAGGVPHFDQRGFAFTRVAGGRIDVGAVERNAASADFDSDLDVDGADFLTWQRGLGASGVAATRSNGNADGDNDVDGADLAVWKAQFDSSAAVAAASVNAAAPTASASAGHRAAASPAVNGERTPLAVQRMTARDAVFTATGLPFLDPELFSRRPAGKPRVRSPWR
ncbi:MAG: hypothetical protein C0485_13975 [Pirellula sp.]|nr:hypothetical protein [Pirellula sp.]